MTLSHVREDKSLTRPDLTDTGQLVQENHTRNNRRILIA